MKKKFNLTSVLAFIKVLPLIVLSGCSAVQIVNSVSKIYPVEVEKDIAFGNNPRNTMDIYYPKSKNEQTETTPVIVFIYGGSWNRGEKSEYEFVGRKLASLGYITMLPNYRVYPEVTYPDFLFDGAKSISTLLTQLKTAKFQTLNPSNKIVLMGHSAGAYNAAMLAMDDRWLAQENLNRNDLVEGLIGMAGAYNIYPIGVPEVRPVFNHPNYPEKSQPIDYVTNSKVPTLLLAPETDELVSLEKNTYTLAKALGEAGTPNQLVTVEGTDHISLIGTLSPVLFFKGDSITPIEQFITELNQAKSQ